MICIKKHVKLSKNSLTNTKKFRFFLAHSNRPAQHLSCCTLYLFGFSEKENPKRMPLHQGEFRLLKFLRCDARGEKSSRSLKRGFIFYFNFDGFKKITYLYDATGSKLKKTITMPNPPKINSPAGDTHYLGGYQYAQDVLQFFPTAEGYVEGKTGHFRYVYNYTDHLGNVRLSYAMDPKTQSIATLQENNYYPFGLRHNHYNQQQQDFSQDQENLVSIYLFCRITSI